MKKITMQKHGTLALFIALTLTLVTSPSLADKPSWAGSKAKNGKHWQKDKRDSDWNHNDGYSYDRHRSGVHVNVYFSDRQRTTIRNYYTGLYRSGHCPPGLAKKNNGCLPPGQAKKWHVGRPLSRDVIFHDIPSEVVVKLGPPPAGHRFVRVASDILLIAVGTGMVIDAIQDLSEY